MQSLRALLLAAFVCVTIQPAVAAPAAEDARAAMARATNAMRAIAAEGGYLWWYSEDLKERAGENKATPTQIWIQPPGTPSMGMAFLRAYGATKDERYLQAAEGAARALAVGQLESGGWDYLVDFDPAQARRWYRRTDKGMVPEADTAKRRNVTTFDDNTTQSALRFLMAFLDTTKGRIETRTADISTCLEYGLAKFLEAQYPNGAWPQRWDGKPREAAQYPVQPARIPKEYPREYPKANYAGHYTLNDNTQRDCIVTMMEAHRLLGKPEYLESAKRGGDFLVLAQLPAPQGAWAQQYNPAMEPAWARAFEPPAVCSAESAGVLRTLLDLYVETGDAKYLKPIPTAVEWFRRSMLRPNTWARFYELGTNTPIYGDRDGKIHYRLDEISEERRTGYSWESSYGISSTIADCERIQRQGREAALRQRQQPRPAPSEARRRSLEPGAKEVIASLDAQGRWVRKGRIETSTFIRNLGVLCDYVEAGGK